MSKGEEKMNGRINKNNIENVVESLIGAIYLDSNIDTVKKFIKKYWYNLLMNQKEVIVDPKTKLQEWLQSHSYNLPKYLLIKEDGNKSNPIYTIEIQVDNLPKFQNSSTKKKEAEKKTANDMINYIKNNIDINI